MIEVIREKNKDGHIIRGSVKCSVCGSPFEMIEGKNATFIVDTINTLNGKDESIDLEAIGKCNVCDYTSKYHVKLKLND